MCCRFDLLGHARCMSAGGRTFWIDRPLRSVLTVAGANHVRFNPAAPGGRAPGVFGRDYRGLPAVLGTPV